MLLLHTTLLYIFSGETDIIFCLQLKGLPANPFKELQILYYNQSRIERFQLIHMFKTFETELLTQNGILIH